jgi:hypothetical protein
MVAEKNPTKEHIIELLDELPQESLAAVADFVQYQRYKQLQKEPRTTRFRPTPLGGLMAGVTITEEDIAEARREMWGKFSDDDLRPSQPTTPPIPMR